MQLTLNVPDELVPRLQAHQAQLAQVLTFGLRELEAKPYGYFNGLNDVLEFLASLPSNEDILRLRPTPELQAQLNQLVEKQKAGSLNAEEEKAWQQYEYIEHLVRKAKISAIKRQQS
ncbi:hypothetical protein [Candidatus Albibeggiatoa sp. nov. NOAA]|uniref:hypothetical protein n=1 Tax=Candidatus Albibeggiatoa sp. nov. NOAA TaxID=3162724 RepID=UPI0032F89C54|nr:hypothetical protein [Thiotrichaceae bacterium]